MRMEDEEIASLVAAVVETNAGLAKAMKLLAEHVRKLTAEVETQKAQLESLAFIQRAGRHA
jgi:hypothetical protein